MEGVKMKKWIAVSMWIVFGLFWAACRPSTTAVSEPVISEAEVENEVVIVPTETAVPTKLPTETPFPTEIPATATTAPTETATAQPPTATPTPWPRIAVEGLFSLHSTEPVVAHGEQGAVDSWLTDPGAVVYHDGLFHMFHNGLSGWPAKAGVFYSTSENGRDWRRMTTEPLFMLSDIDYVPYTGLITSALVDEDGHWSLYFYTIDGPNWPLLGGSIGRLTAPDPTGPWTAEEDFVLLPGNDGSWDQFAVREPSVMQTNDGYRMYYAGATKNRSMIGMATSEDGVSWTKFKDPSLDDPAFVESAPVLMSSGVQTNWDSSNVMQPRIQQSPDGWVLAYSAMRGLGNGGSRVHGFAISEDGVGDWVRSDSAVITRRLIPRSSDSWATAFVFQDGVYYYYFESNGQEGSNVYLATYEGLLTE